MTGPQSNHSTNKVNETTVEFDGGTGCWILHGKTAGPAGELTLWIDGVQVVLDALEPHELVELTVFPDPDSIASEPDGEADRGGVMPQAAEEVVLALLGAAAAAALSGRTPGVVPVADGHGSCKRTRHAWGQLALAKALTGLPEHDSQLRDMDLARLAVPCGDLLRPAAISYAEASLRPALNLARSLARSADVLDLLAPPAREQLGDVLTIMRRHLNDPTSLGGAAATEDVQQLDNALALLAPIPDDPGMLLTAPDAALTALAARQRELVLRGVATDSHLKAGAEWAHAGGEVVWTENVALFLPRLGTDADLFSPGIIEVALTAGPDAVTVRVPIALTTTASDLADVVLRLSVAATKGGLDDARFLESGLAVSTPPELEPVPLLPGSENTGPAHQPDQVAQGTAESAMMPYAYATFTLAESLPGECVIVLDLVGRGRRTGTPAEQHDRLSHLAAIHDAQRAQSATIRGDLTAAAGHWQNCADAWADLERPELKAAAEAQRDKVGRAPAMNSLGGGAAPGGVDWVSALEGAYATITAHICDTPDPDPAGYAGRLRNLVSDLRQALGSSTTLARAQHALATHLAEHPDLALDPSEISDNLFEALRNYHAHDNTEQARQCLIDLRTITNPPAG